MIQDPVDTVICDTHVVMWSREQHAAYIIIHDHLSVMVFQ